MIAGVLYPRSGAHPAIATDWIDGLKAFIQEKLPDADIRLLLESVGFGGAEKEVYEKTEKLLLIEKVDVLVAFIDLKVLTVLEPLLYSTGKLMIVVNPGANYPYNWIPQPNIIYLTLHHAFLCRLSGLLAAKTPNTSAATATTFFDCGYLHTAAMVNGFAERGGNITFNYVNNQPSYKDGFDITPLTTFLQAAPATATLLCTMDSYPAQLFYNQLDYYASATDLQLFVSPMMLEEKAFTTNKEFAFSINGYIPWEPSIDSDTNEDFKSCYETYAKKEATVFSLLGWETGLIIQQVIQHSSRQPDGSEIADHLKQVTLKSPRGAMQLDAETQYYLTPAIQCTISKSIIKKQHISIETLKLYWNEFIARPAEGISSGWTNTYLCY